MLELANDARPVIEERPGPAALVDDATPTRSRSMRSRMATDRANSPRPIHSVTENSKRCVNSATISAARGSVRRNEYAPYFAVFVLPGRAATRDPGFPFLFMLMSMLPATTPPLTPCCVHAGEHPPCAASWERIPAGNFASVCGTFIGGRHPDTGRHFTIVEPQVGGWGGSASRDGASALLSDSRARPNNCPVEVAEARYGLYVDRHLLGRNQEVARRSRLEGLQRSQRVL
jgi:hypothetical protein